MRASTASVFGAKPAHRSALALSISGWLTPGTRHTCATVALMAGVPPAYIANQLGNSVKMLLDRYARWIPGGDQGNARALLVAAMTGDSEGIRPKFVPMGTFGVPPETEKPKQINDLLGLVIGRRDWTRTNDPHHVKVVL